MIKVLRYGISTVRAENQLIEFSNGFYPTKYGNLKLIQSPFKDEFTKIHYLRDGVGSNFLRSIFKNEPKSLMLFDADKMHYLNALELYQATKSMLNISYFGTLKKPHDPFVQCKSPRDVFHLYRKILNEQKRFLYRINLLVSYNGEVRIQGSYPETGELKYILEPDNISNLAYQKHSYLLPFTVFQGLATAHSYEKDGISIDELQTKIYALHGVWVPSQRQYLQLFKQYIQRISKQHEIQKIQKLNIIDLGCGTGVLGFIANLILSKLTKCAIYGLDEIQNAVKSAKINSQSLELTNYRAEVADINNPKLEYLLKEYNYPNKYDLIISNPPWIQASRMSTMNIENTTLDPDGAFLESVFKFAKQYLQQESINSSKGRLVLIYSDLSQILGLQEKQKIQNLCTQYHMQISYKEEIPFINKEHDYDPLQKYKQDSKVQIFEIQNI